MVFRLSRAFRASTATMDALQGDVHAGSDYAGEVGEEQHLPCPLPSGPSRPPGQGH